MKVKWNEEKENIEKLIKEGVSYERIGRQYGVTGNSVKKAAKKLGIELERKREINPNEHFNKGKHGKIKNSHDICPICGKEKYHSSKLCRECSNREKRSIKKRTLGSFINGHHYLTTKCGDIRKDARRTIEESKQEKVCAYCHNHEFDDILEVHHLKGILEFDESTTIEEINSENNLVWLCPNHHKMLEMGLIKL